MKKEISIWYTDKNNQRGCIDWYDIKNLDDAKTKAKKLEKEGCTAINIDVDYFELDKNGGRGEKIEEKTKYYSFKDGKTNLI